MLKVANTFSSVYIKFNKTNSGLVINSNNSLTDRDLQMLHRSVIIGTKKCTNHVGHAVGLSSLQALVESCVRDLNGSVNIIVTLYALQPHIQSNTYIVGHCALVYVHIHDK